jgi:hypothetical protein
MNGIRYNVIQTINFDFDLSHLLVFVWIFHPIEPASSRAVDHMLKGRFTGIVAKGDIKDRSGIKFLRELIKIFRGWLKSKMGTTGGQFDHLPEDFSPVATDVDAIGMTTQRSPH